MSSLISVPFQNNTNFPMGTGSRIQDGSTSNQWYRSDSENRNLIVRWMPQSFIGWSRMRRRATGLGYEPTFSFPAKPAVIWGFSRFLLLPPPIRLGPGSGQRGHRL